MKLKILLLIPIIFFIQSVIASSYIYITDHVDLPMRSDSKIVNSPSNVIRMLPSGTKLELLSTTKTGWTQVKFENDTGWIISRYLTSKEPSMVQLRRLKDSNNSNKSSTSGINVDKVIVNHNNKIHKLNIRYKSLLHEIDQIKDQHKVDYEEFIELHKVEMDEFKVMKIKFNTLLKEFNVDGDLLDNIADLTISAYELEKKRKIEITRLEKIQSKLIKEKQKVADISKIEKKIENERYKEQQRLVKYRGKVDKAKEEFNLIKEQISKAENQIKKTMDKRKKVEDEFKQRQYDIKLREEIQQEIDIDRLVFSENILNELKSNYTSLITSRVLSNWRYLDAEDDWSCQVYILQDIDGVVQSVNLQSCNIGNSAMAKSFKDSIERAIYKSSPLPKVPDIKVFDREIFFDFRVN